MQDWITSWTSLPNLHPAVVHFPIVLLPIAVVCDLVGLTGAGRRRGARGLAVILWVAAGLSATLAKWAGEQAGDSLVDLPARTHTALGTHSDWGHYTWWVVGSLVLLRLGIAWWERGGTPRPSWPVGVVALLGLGGVGMTLYTADLGGALVYQHGVGVRPAISTVDVSEPPPLDENANVRGSAVARLVERDDEGWSWAPLPGDTDAFGTVLHAATGSSLDSVVVGRPETDASQGLALEVDGEALLLLPDEFGDVQVTVELELLGFEGQVGIAHHVRSIREAGLFTLAVPEGVFALVTRRGDAAEKRLDEELKSVPSEPLRLAVSAAGSHIRGTLNGALVVHGHEPALPAGGCGLFFDGRGRLRVLRVEVEPIAH